MFWNKEKSTVTRYLKSVDFTHTATPEGTILLHDGFSNYIYMYYTDVAYRV